jgi:hypothetical protein
LAKQLALYVTKPYSLQMAAIYKNYEKYPDAFRLPRGNLDWQESIYLQIGLRLCSLLERKRMENIGFGAITGENARKSNIVTISFT